MTVPLPPFPLCLAQGQGAGRQDGRQRGETIYSGDCAVPSSGRLFTRYFSFNIFIVPDCRAAFIMLIIQTKDFPGETVKHLPTMQETRVQSLGWEDSLEKEMTTHSSTLAWKIPWTEEPGRPQSMWSQRVGHD